MRLACALALLATATLATASAPLTFDQDGKFRILQLTDLHFGHTFGTTNNKTLETMRKVIADEDPDLVILTGDQYHGFGETSSYAQQIKDTWTLLAGPMIDANKPWAMVFGNHDDSDMTSGVTRAVVVQHIAGLAGSLTKAGPESIFGVANYALKIYHNTTLVEPNAPAAVLWMLSTTDSNYSITPSVEGGLTQGQVDWFTASAASLKTNYSLSSNPFSMMFFHIPPQEMRTLWDTEVCYGTKNEGVSIPPVNTGMYTAALNAGVRGIFLGHDHSNDFCGAFQAHPDLALCYGRKTGTFSYNDVTKKQGGRVIELTLNKATGAVTWTTWLRDKDGAKINQTSLVHQPENASSTPIVALALLILAAFIAM